MGRNSLAYYNEIDPYAAQWLRNLISAGHIAPGDVDERDIREVQPEEIEGYAQCHFFAGIGVWSYALRMAGWPDNQPVWTGSCPCQPFSTAGKKKGTADDRHLWPEFFRLIQKCSPSAVFGEQVAGKAGLAWLDLVSADLEGASYVFGAADLSACGVGAPHIRQRLYWVAQSESRRKWADRQEVQRENRGCSISGGVAQSDSQRFEGIGVRICERRPLEDMPEAPRGGEVRGFWNPADWVLCRDPKGPRWRPTEPSSFPLVHGAPQRVGQLRAYGNAICAPLATEFIKAVMAC